MTRCFCDSCKKEIIDIKLTDEELATCRKASSIMEAADYSIDIDVCPECAEWLCEKVSELIENKFHFRGLEE